MAAMAAFFCLVLDALGAGRAGFAASGTADNQRRHEKDDCPHEKYSAAFSRVTEHGEPEEQKNRSQNSKQKREDVGKSTHGLFCWRAKPAVIEAEAPAIRVNGIEFIAQIIVAPLVSAVSSNVMRAVAAMPVPLAISIRAGREISVWSNAPG
jgi:hypothetical protein